MYIHITNEISWKLVVDRRGEYYSTNRSNIVRAASLLSPDQIFAVRLVPLSKDKKDNGRVVNI